MVLEAESGFLSCPDGGCFGAGVQVWLWRASDAAVAAGAPDRCPAGWPRPGQSRKGAELGKDHLGRGIGA